MFCADCGAYAPDDANFCSNCGKNLEQLLTLLSADTQSGGYIDRRNVATPLASVSTGSIINSPSLRKSKKVNRKLQIAILILLAVFSLSALMAVPLLSKPIPEKHRNKTVALFWAIPGDTVEFGHYEQDNDLTNGTETIEWLVLKINEGRACLISKYCLDAKPYNEDRSDVNWETCTLRGWLNNEFINEAFTSEERSMIEPSSLVGEHMIGQGFTYKTIDKIFLLSSGEVESCFDSTGERMAKPTAYALAQGVHKDENENAWWWLRSPGSDQAHAAIVGDDGVISTSGITVSLGSNGIRPVLWVNIPTSIFD